MSSSRFGTVWARFWNKYWIQANYTILAFKQIKLEFLEEYKILFLKKFKTTFMELTSSHLKA